MFDYKVETVTDEYADVRFLDYVKGADYTEDDAQAIPPKKED